MILSCITMLIDHIGYVFFPGVITLRIIGRLAMPIYAYFIAEGYRHTSNIKKYIMRLAITAAVSQIPFMLLFDTRKLNMCFAWLFSLLIIYGIEKKNYPVLVLTVAATIPVLLTISVDYRIYGILIPLIYYLRNKTKSYYKDFVMLFGVTLIMAAFQNSIQLFAAAAVPLILIAEKNSCTRIKNKAVKRCYQCFYPAHMIVLFAVKMIMTRV